MNVDNPYNLIYAPLFREGLSCLSNRVIIADETVIANI